METMRTILCYGDSNTWGYNPATGARHPYEARWPTVAAKELGEGYHLIPEGMNGRTTVQDDAIDPYTNGLEYLAPCLISHKPLDAVIIALGTNDTKARFSLAPADIARGMRRLIRLVQTSESGPREGAPRVGIVAPPIIRNESFFGGSFAGAARRSAGIVEEYRVIAEELSVPILEAGRYVEFAVPDGIHLDAPGQLTLGRSVATWVREELLP